MHTKPACASARLEKLRTVSAAGGRADHCPAKDVGQEIMKSFGCRPFAGAAALTVGRH